MKKKKTNKYQCNDVINSMDQSDERFIQKYAIPVQSAWLWILHKEIHVSTSEGMEKLTNSHHPKCIIRQKWMVHFVFCIYESKNIPKATLIACFAMMLNGISSVFNAKQQSSLPDPGPLSDDCDYDFKNFSLVDVNILVCWVWCDFF